MTIRCIRNSALLIRSCVRTHKRQLGDFFNTNEIYRKLTWTYRRGVELGVHDSVEAVLLLQPDWLRKRIAEAATWADAELSRRTAIQVPRERLLRGDPSPELRSGELDPANFGGEFFRRGHGNFPAVEKLVQRRAELIGSRTVVSSVEGRGLLFIPQDSLSDGAATVQSGGFFDLDNVPAWDTWIYFDGRTLLSWVPTSLISKVQSGIDVNPEGCIKWADNTAQ
jgi:hypothetical protein